MLTQALVVLLVSSVALPARAASGDLDRTFGGYGSGGRVISDPFPGTSINATVATPDDKLIAVGTNGQGFVVVRYDASGKLDRTSGTNGVTTLDFAGQADVATAVALTDDAKSIVVVGTAMVGVHSAD